MEVTNGSDKVTTLYPLEGDELLSHCNGVACSQRNLLERVVVDPVTGSDNRHRERYQGRVCPPTTPGQART
jgi:hypothetical protein